MKIQNIVTLGQLKASGYQPKTIKEEIRQNLITRLKTKKKHSPASLVLKKR